MGRRYALPMRAQVAGDTITSRAHAVPQVSVTGRRTRPMLTSASPLQQLNREEMERMGGACVADIVRHFSGINVKRLRRHGRTEDRFDTQHGSPAHGRKLPTVWLSVTASRDK